MTYLVEGYLINGVESYFITIDVFYFQVKSSLCTDAPSPEKKIWEWALVCTWDNSGGASSSNVESYNRSNSGIIITKNLVHFVLLLKDNSLSHFRTPKN